MKKLDIIFALAVIFIVALVVALLAGLDRVRSEHEAQQRDEAWNGPCHDTSTLVATTSGSPNYATCMNRHHRMHVEAVTKASNEEIGAIVFCQCVTDDGGAL